MYVNKVGWEKISNWTRHRLQDKRPKTSLGYTGQVKVRMLCRTQKMIKHHQKKIVTGILNGEDIIRRLLDMCSYPICRNRHSLVLPLHFLSVVLYSIYNYYQTLFGSIGISFTRLRNLTLFSEMGEKTPEKSVTSNVILSECGSQSLLDHCTQFLHSILQTLLHEYWIGMQAALYFQFQSEKP